MGCTLNHKVCTEHLDANDLDLTPHLMLQLQIYNHLLICFIDLLTGLLQQLNFCSLHVFLSSVLSAS